ncbi:hypothetical protein V8C42DRAFT_207334 [Trichoderma barbatum]
MSYFHEIPEARVLEAPILAKSQPFRINLIPGELNIVFFKLLFDQERDASVEFYITPLYHANARHTLYAVEASYTPSHEDIHVDQVLAAAQLIYDTYINVILLKLNGDILKRQAQEPFSSSTPPNPPPIDASDRIVPLASNRSVSLENSRKRPRSDTAIFGSDTEADGERTVCTVNEPGGGTTTTSSRDEVRKVKLQSLAKNLVTRIKKGQDDIKKREMESGQEVNCDDAFFQCLIPYDGKSFNLDQVEKILSGIDISHTDNRKTWTHWFFSSCLQIVREEAEHRWQITDRHRNRKHKPFQAAKVANLIVNKLLISDGISAMGVYNALAESNHKLSKAAELTPEDMEYFSNLVAMDLRGQIYAAAYSSLVPFPALWLSELFQRVQWDTDPSLEPYQFKYYGICHIIGVPQLAALDLGQAWSLESKEHLSVIGVKMSVLEEHWKKLASVSGLEGMQQF